MGNVVTGGPYRIGLLHESSCLRRRIVYFDFEHGISRQELGGVLSRDVFILQLRLEMPINDDCKSNSRCDVSTLDIARLRLLFNVKRRFLHLVNI
jgi:hypothetical protein